jgi:hypothetical protein
MVASYLQVRTISLQPPAVADERAGTCPFCYLAVTPLGLHTLPELSTYVLDHACTACAHPGACAHSAKLARSLIPVSLRRT